MLKLLVSSLLVGLHRDPDPRTKWRIRMDPQNCQEPSLQLLPLPPLTYNYLSFYLFLFTSLFILSLSHFPSFALPLKHMGAVFPLYIFYIDLCHEICDRLHTSSLLVRNFLPAVFYRVLFTVKDSRGPNDTGTVISNALWTSFS